MVLAGDQPLVAPLEVLCSRERKAYVPAEPVNRTVRVVTPVCQIMNEPPPTFFSMSYVNPDWVAEVSVIVNVVDAVPVVGDTRIGTFTIPVMKVWIEQW